MNFSITISSEVSEYFGEAVLQGTLNFVDQ